MGPSREARIAALLLGIGAASFATAWWVHREQTRGMVERPEATGDVGFLAVYAQLERGPVRLVPNERTQLPRPQDLTFQWVVQGSGPRLVRIELVTGSERLVLHEEKLQAPSDQVPLTYMLHLDDTAPNELSVVVTIEAPHARALTLTHPLVLVGSEVP
ncbi:MAG: hypothetical protein IT384_27625 [Deltaproteobacteria bacterium]|nr:hypothetical protein [Deltaproteobacteria bacterium]